jgi:transcriptional regulator with XRE-family HTH domain
MLSAKEIGSKIKKMRQEAGLSQERLSEIIGVTFQQVQKYESGHTGLSLVKLQQIAEALRRPVVDFFEEQRDQGVGLTAQEDELLRAFRRLRSQELKKCVMTIAKNLNKKTMG